MFGWLLALGKVTTFDVLQKRRPFRSLSPNWCVLCKKNLESIDHVFLHCSFSLHIWSRLLLELGQVWVVPKKCEDIFELEYFMHSNKRGQLIWNVAVLVIVWSLWLERNCRIFEGSVVDVDDFWNKVLYRVSLSLSVNKLLSGFLISDIVRGWRVFL